MGNRFRQKPNPRRETLLPTTKRKSKLKRETETLTLYMPHTKNKTGNQNYKSKPTKKTQIIANRKSQSRNTNTKS